MGKTECRLSADPENSRYRCPDCHGSRRHNRRSQRISVGQGIFGLSGSGTETNGNGGRVKLLGISKRGDTYLRTLFIHGARVATLLTKTPLPWVTGLKKRRPVCVAIVGMANKLARTVWALVAHQQEYQKDYVSVRPY
ncbi:transposase [Xenorhabdus miraniensis]|uniref:Transposase n=1 Tax=Xenorhabdus miraniensis TaxID=351674 RepID=A0A2D0J7B8_9GAMM|nr:transposase [Xenorhabdus miraniensis]